MREADFDVVLDRIVFAVVDTAFFSVNELFTRIHIQPSLQLFIGDVLQRSQLVDNRQ